MQKMCYTNCKLYDSMRKREENSMVTAVRSLGLQGISGYEVTVECFLSGGLPAFDIVGLGDTAVKESRERVRAAVKNCGVKFPVSRVVIVDCGLADEPRRVAELLCRSEYEVYLCKKEDLTDFFT